MNLIFYERKLVATTKILFNNLSPIKKFLIGTIATSLIVSLKVMIGFSFKLMH